ncbi:MAG: ATP-dependent zinc metalloprotease FtsH [Candidatus Goldbacteria bacterium]|nr:ATP-dependent zinc metalloprotease FtsH [Candidatus Goldiibacteriota bacterium]
MSNRSFSFSFWLFLFIVLIIFINYFSILKETSPKKLTYSEFIEKVKNNEILEVTIYQKDNGINEIEGLFRDNIKFFSSAPVNDDYFFKVLHENKVKISVKLPGSTVSRFLSTFFIYWGPIILLIVFWLFIFNRAQGGAGGAISFGKSRAKLAEVAGKVTFKDVAGIDEAKEELAEIIEFLKDPKKFQKIGGKIPKGVLLLGPPGSGKTLLARAVAGEAGVPFFSISGSDFVEMFVGVGAARVRDLFEQGKKNAPCIVFIDEIDAVGRYRGAGLGGGHDEREQTLNALLVEMDGFEANTGVIIIAATNRPDILDPALLRPGRFDRQIVVDRPDLNGREGILKVHTRKILLDPGVDLKIIARRTSGFSGADLANLANEAALLAARRNKKAVTMEEFEEAIDRVIAGPQRKSRVISDDEKKRIAYHESGHALVARHLPNTYPVHKISIIPRGYGALGYTLQLPTEDRFLATKTEIINNITVLLGGRAAEEIVFNKEISTGASNDIEKATNMAHKMVCEYGMSEKLGSLTYGKSSREIFLGKDLMREKNYSEKTAQLIDKEVNKIINNSYKKAKMILIKDRKLLDKIAHTLLEKEIIEGEDFENLFRQYNGKEKIDKKVKKDEQGKNKDSSKNDT